MRGTGKFFPGDLSALSDGLYSCSSYRVLYLNLPTTEVMLLEISTVGDAESIAQRGHTCQHSTASQCRMLLHIPIFLSPMLLLAVVVEAMFTLTLPYI